MLLELDNGYFSCFINPVSHMSYWHEDIKSRKNLLITLGDSWTWGDSLGIADFSKNINDPNRINYIYGRHLQHLIGDCDWINLAFPGTANQWIVDSAERFVNISKQVNYDSVILSIGLTDITRDVCQGLIENQQLLKSKSLQEMCHIHEQRLFNKIKQIESNNNITVLVGRNFTDTLTEESKKSIKYHLPLRWVDITAAKCEMPQPDKCIGYKLPTGLSVECKQWALENIINPSLAMSAYLNASPLHFKKATKHPTKDAHKFWAEYIFDYLKNINEKELAQ